jgi:hypothetical protein
MDETAQTIGPSQPGKVDVADERRRTGWRRRTLAERSVGAVRVVVLDVLRCCSRGRQVHVGEAGERRRVGLTGTDTGSDTP